MAIDNKHAIDLYESMANVAEYAKAAARYADEGDAALKAALDE